MNIGYIETLNGEMKNFASINDLSEKDCLNFAKDMLDDNDFEDGTVIELECQTRNYTQQCNFKAKIHELMKKYKSSDILSIHKMDGVFITIKNVVKGD